MTHWSKRKKTWKNQRKFRKNPESNLYRETYRETKKKRETILLSPTSLPHVSPPRLSGLRTVRSRSVHGAFREKSWKNQFFSEKLIEKFILLSPTSLPHVRPESVRPEKNQIFSEKKSNIFREKREWLNERLKNATELTSKRLTDWWMNQLNLKRARAKIWCKFGTDVHNLTNFILSEYLKNRKKNSFLDKDNKIEAMLSKTMFCTSQMALDIDDFHDKWAKSKVKFTVLIVFWYTKIYFSEFARKTGLSVDHRRGYTKRILISKKKNLVCT